MAAATPAPRLRSIQNTETPSIGSPCAERGDQQEPGSVAAGTQKLRPGANAEPSGRQAGKNDKAKNAGDHRAPVPPRQHDERRRQRVLRLDAKQTQQPASLCGTVLKLRQARQQQCPAEQAELAKVN